MVDSTKNKVTGVYFGTRERALKLLAVIEERSVSKLLREAFDTYISTKYGPEFVERMIDLSSDSGETVKLLTEMELKIGKPHEETIEGIIQKVASAQAGTVSEAED